MNPFEGSATKYALNPCAWKGGQWKYFLSECNWVNFFGYHSYFLHECNMKNVRPNISLKLKYCRSKCSYTLSSCNRSFLLSGFLWILWSNLWVDTFQLPCEGPKYFPDKRWPFIRCNHYLKTLTLCALIWLQITHKLF